MLKRFALVLIAAVCLLLSACTGWMSGSYASVTPHLEQENPEEPEIIRASNYQELCAALTELIDDGAAGGTISLGDFSSDAAAVSGMQDAIRYAVNEYPLGAYAVQEITFESGSRGGLAAFAVSIEYRRTEADIAQIQNAHSIDGALSAIYSALSTCSPSLTLKVQRYEETDFTQVVEDYAAMRPDLVMETPQVSVSFYPENGPTRIVELKFTYENSRDSLRAMQDQVELVFDSAKLYVSGSSDDHQKLSQLYSFLMERYDYQVNTSITPAYSLLCHGVGDSKAFANVFAAMCSNAGLDCVSVPGTRDGEPWTWNILKDGDYYYHVDLLRCVQSGGFLELGDHQMEGYVWDFSAFPACGAPEPPPEDTTPGGTTETTPEDPTAPDPDPTEESAEGSTEETP